MSETSDKMADVRTALAGQPKDDLMNRAVELDPDHPAGDLETDTPYLGEVYNVVHYGVFVQLTESWGSDVSGLVHESKLPSLTETRDYSPGDRMVVEFDEQSEDGDLSFTGLFSPDVDASGVTLTDVRDVFQTLDGQLTDMTERLDELETEGQGGGGGFQPADDPLTIPSGMDGLTSVISRLNSEGYDVGTLTTTSHDGGDVIELNATLTRSETGDSDD